MPDSSTILLADDEDSIQKLLAYPLAETLADEFRAVTRSTGHQLSVRANGPAEGLGDEERAL